MAFALKCEGCGAAFEAKSGRAKWCSDKCRKRAQRDRAASARVPRPTLTVVSISDYFGPADDDRREVLPYSVARTLQRALEEIDDPDAITEYRMAHALTLATVLDNPAQANLWRGITAALHEVLTHLIAAKPEANALADIVAAIRGT